MGAPVIVTRPDGPYAGAKHLLDALAAAGFDPVQFSVLSCEQCEISHEDGAQILEALRTPRQWLVFLSPTAVAVFRDLLLEQLDGASLPESVRIAAQGAGSSEMVRSCFGRAADFIPSVFVAEHFAEEFMQRVGSDEPVLVAQSSEGRDVFAQTLRGRGYRVTTVETYTTRSVTPSPETIASVVAVQARGPVYLLFMSPSAVQATVSALGEHRAFLESVRIVSVGPITTREVMACGLTVAAEAVEHSVSGVVSSLTRLVNQ